VLMLYRAPLMRHSLPVCPSLRTFSALPYRARTVPFWIRIKLTYARCTGRTARIHDTYLHASYTSRHSTTYFRPIHAHCSRYRDHAAEQRCHLRTSSQLICTLFVERNGAGMATALHRTHATAFSPAVLNDTIPHYLLLHAHTYACLRAVAYTLLRHHHLKMTRVFYRAPLLCSFSPFTLPRSLARFCWQNRAKRLE